MRLFGVVLIASGGALIFWVLRATVAGSPGVSQPSSSDGSSSTGGSASSGGGAAGDSGAHMALNDAGQLYQIVSDYAGMSDAQKGDANRFAHTYPSGLSVSVVAQ